MTKQYNVDTDPQMADLFQEAEAKGLWFYCGYQDLWLHPKDLKQAHSEGRFRWGPVNWRLRPPQDRKKELAEAIQEAKQRYEAFCSDMARAR